jgi:hypothetical protein
MKIMRIFFYYGLCANKFFYLYIKLKYQNINR